MKSFFLFSFLCGLMFGAQAAKLTEVVRQKDLVRPWGNAQIVSNADGVIKVESAKADGPAALSAGASIPVSAGDECVIEFDARGTVRLQVMTNYPDSSNKRFDLLAPTQLNKENWKSFRLPFTIPAGSSKVSVDFLVWQQTGIFEIRNYRLTAPAKRPETMLLDEYFRRGEFRNNRFSETVPAGWTSIRSGNAADTDCGGLTKEFSAVSPDFHALRIPAVSEGTAGWINGTTPVYRPLRASRLSMRYRTEKGYAGNEPVVRFTFQDKAGKDLAGNIEFVLPLPAAGNWKVAEFDIPPAKIPADAATFRTMLVTRRKGTEKPAGELLYGFARITLPVTEGTFAQIRGSEYANWFKLGRPVVFKPEGVLPPDATGIEVKVYNQSGDLLDTAKLSAADFDRKGWQYLPKEPGFYLAEFTAVTPTGKRVLGDEYLERAMNNHIGLFELTRHAFAVVAPRRDATPFPPLVGYQVGYDKSGQRWTNELEQISRAGGNFARFHVTWMQLEPEKGKFEWEGLDKLVKRCVELGVKPIICFYGTPRWASNTPDDTRYVVHVWGYNAYAAKDVNDWTNFVSKLVDRYKGDVDTWEVWNEPHLRNYSCYWHDTPENYVMLLKSAYETIKGIQPDSKVWIGGMALRYLPFYEAIMKLGAGPYFDYFAMHGHGQSIKPFHALDRQYGSPEHPWVASEWHANLMRYNSPNYKISSGARSIMMLSDMFNMVREGVEQIAFFEPFNLVEKETLKLHSDGGAPLNHTSGIFRRKPYFQPEPDAVIMYNFGRQLSGKTGITGTYRFGGQKAVAFASDYGPMLAFWQEQGSPSALEPELAAVVKNAKVESWEGRPVASPATMKLPVSTMFFASNVEIPANWVNDPHTLVPDRPKLHLHHKVRGVYGDKPLFDANGKLIERNINWNSRDFELVRLDGAPNNLKVNSRFAVALAGEKLQLVLETDDPVLFQPVDGGAMWQGDSVEFAFDATNEGYASDRVEFVAGKGQKGDELFKSANPTITGDLPTEWTMPNMTVKYGWAKVEHIPARKTTRYLVEMTASELYPLLPEAGKPLRFSLIVNESDGKNRIGVNRWSRGIFEAKNPVEYGDLVPAKK